MDKAMPSYEDRLRNPGLSIINFEYLLNHPESVYEVWIRYKQDPTFQMQVLEKNRIDVVFKNRFFNYFKSFAQNEEFTR